MQVKGPLLTPASIADADKRGKTLRTRDPNGSKPYARGATALGVALGLGEVAEKDVNDEAVAKRFDLYSSVASTSAGGELKNCEVLLFGNSPSGDRRPAHRPRHPEGRDRRRRRARCAEERRAFVQRQSDRGRREAHRRGLRQGRGEPTGSIRGRRNTMLSDADINYERHARAAVGAVIASITLDPAIFVSGGTEHQCAPGAAPIAAIVRV